MTGNPSSACILVKVLWSDPLSRCVSKAPESGFVMGVSIILVLFYSFRVRHGNNNRNETHQLDEKNPKKICLDEYCTTSKDRPKSLLGGGPNPRREVVRGIERRGGRREAGRHESTSVICHHHSNNNRRRRPMGESVIAGRTTRRRRRRRRTV